MSEENYKKEAKRITDKLSEIRERTGASKSPYEKQIMTGEEFIEIIKKIRRGKPLIINGRFCFVYIQNHPFLDYASYQEEVRNAPNQCLHSDKGRKVHFYRCKTLDYMEKIKKTDKYCNTSHLVKNKCEIDLKDRNGVIARLAWCKNCLEILLEDGQLLYNLGGRNSVAIIEIKAKVAIGADSKKVIDCVKSYHRVEDGSINKIRQFFKAFMQEKDYGKINWDKLWKNR